MNNFSFVLLSRTEASRHDRARLNLIIGLIFRVEKNGQLGKKIRFNVLRV